MLAAPSSRLQSMIVSVVARPEPTRDRDQHGTGADPQEREADNEVGVVVEELERDDPGVPDLQQQAGETHQEELGVVRASRSAAGRGGALAHCLGAGAGHASRKFTAAGRYHAVKSRYLATQPRVRHRHLDLPATDTVDAPKCPSDAAGNLRSCCLRSIRSAVGVDSIRGRRGRSRWGRAGRRRRVVGQVLTA